MSVRLDNVGFHFPSHPWLFRGVSADIRADDVTALVGPSGSGKSTMLALIAGWLHASEGSVSITARKDGSPAKLNWVFQNPHGIPRRSAHDHVIVPLLAQGYSIRQAEAKALELMEDFALTHVKDRPFSTLSGGEGQRLMLARALASQPDVLLVDEPTAQLDQRTARQVSDTLQSLHSRGIAVIIATHDLSVRDQCSRVIDLADFVTFDEEPHTEEEERREKFSSLT